MESNVSSQWHFQSFNYIWCIHFLSVMETRASITFIIYSYFGNDWFTNHVLFTVFLDCFDAAVNWNSPFTVRGRNSGAHAQNDTFCLQKALTVPKQQQFCLQTTQLANKCMSSSNQPLHSGQQKTKSSTRISAPSCKELDPESVMLWCKFYWIHWLFFQTVAEKSNTVNITFLQLHSKRFPEQLT